MLRSNVPALRVAIAAVFLCALGTAAAHDRSAARVSSDVPLEPGTVLLSPTDTYLNTNKKNYSASTTLPAYTWPDYQVANAIVMKFNFTSLPAGAIVTGAKLHLALIASDNKPETLYTVTAHKVIGRNPNITKATGFSADGLIGWTPNNCCSGGAPLAQADISPPYASRAIDKTNGYKTWDLTAMVQEWLLNPATNFGVVLNSDPAKPRDRHRTFASMEYATASLRPYLEVTLGTIDATPPTVAITAPVAGDVSGTIGVTAAASDNVAVIGVQFRLNGAALGPEQLLPPYTFNWNTTAVSDGNYLLTAVARDLLGNTAMSAPVAVTVMNGMAVLSPQDTSLNINANNYSADPSLTTYTWPDFQPANAILMKFDLSLLPANAVVEEAQLFLALTQSDGLPAPAYSVAASKVLNHNPVIALATGYTADGVTSWTPNGCCHDGVPLAQSDISPPYATVEVDKAPGFKSWNITALVQEWLADPAANFGVLLGSDAAKARDHFRFFASMENPNASLRPYLRVLYSLRDDATPPVVGDVTSSGVTPTAATISWTTDEASNSQVEYGLTTAYGSTTPIDGALVTAHAVALSGLTEGRQYHFRVRSRDQAGNLATSDDFTFATPDSTAPSVSLTAPAAGATVSGTVSVTANASDNVGVAGVQFTLDGANYGAEDTAAPYSSSWNTSGVPDGNHTLTAVARDAAGNVTSSTAVIVNVLNAPPPPPPPGAGIAASYPGDVGIENDPSVVFVERFDESTLTTLFARWTDILNGSAMSFSTDAPAGSPVGKSLNIPWSSGNTGGHLYRQLSPGVDDTLYVRYYVKYPTNNDYSHNGIWMGGYNPPLGWPNPQAGVKPTGSDRFSAAAEQNTLTNRFDHYNYWMGMRQSSDGNYWGNLLLNNADVQAGGGVWTCVEQMVKLNSPVTSSNGEHAVWLNGVKVSHLGQGFPNGTWSGGIFTQDPGGAPFGGLQWRNTSNLNLNYMWLQVYATNGAGSLKYAHVVAAKNYIGCLASGSPPPPATPPSVSMTAPAAGATVSGTITVSANATDSSGVAGVQFKLDGANLGAEDTTAPYSVSLNTTTIANGSHALTAVARNTAALTSTATPVTVTVSNIAGGAWPNDPPTFTTVTDQPWNLLSGNGWNFLRRTASKDPNIAVDAATPLSPSNMLRMVFTTDMQQDTEPSVHWHGLSGIKEVYTGWWMKLSPNWTCSPAGCGKVTFLFTNGSGQVYTGVYHSAAGGGPPYRIAANTEWAPYGQHIWYPNVTTTPVSPGEWHRIEFYYKWETTPGVSGDGIIRWWVDGTLNGNYTNVHYPAGSFIEFQYAPTLQNPPPAEQYMYVDHTYIRRR